MSRTPRARHVASGSATAFTASIHRRPNAALILMRSRFRGTMTIRSFVVQSGVVDAADVPSGVDGLADGWVDGTPVFAAAAWICMLGEVGEVDTESFDCIAPEVSDKSSAPTACCLDAALFARRFQAWLIRSRFLLFVGSTSSPLEPTCKDRSAQITALQTRLSLDPTRRTRSSSAYAGSPLARWFSVRTTAAFRAVRHRSRPVASSPLTILPSPYTEYAFTGGSWKKSPAYDS